MEAPEPRKSAALLIRTSILRLLEHSWSGVKAPPEEAYEYIQNMGKYSEGVEKYIYDLDQVPTFRDYPDALIKK